MYQIAITRKPCSRFSEGITTARLGKPDLQLALEQHDQYIRALKLSGLQVLELEPEEAFPDSCFVEDTAVVVDELAIITNPGAASRRGEVESMIPILSGFRKPAFIQPPGTLEGGDVMQAGKHFYIGLTERTNAEGAYQLGALLSGFGYSYTAIPVTSALHLKSVVNYIGDNTFLASREFVVHPAFKKFKMVEVPDEEVYAANCLLINDKLIVPKGFESVRSAVLAMNYDVIEVDMSEFEKMDGGLSCLSLRFS